MEKQNILVVGASGSVGSEVVHLLKAQGHNVKAATSKIPQAKEQVQIDLVTGVGIKEAFDGVDRAFFMSPPGYADQHKILSPLIQEAKRRSLKKIVLMTAMGANAVETSPFRKAEIELEKSGLHYNIVRPNWFMQNFHTFWIQGIREQRKILLPVGQAQVSFIDARDIAEVIAKLLLDSKLSNKAFDITGPEALDHHEVANMISLATNKEIIYQEIEPQVLKDNLLKVGFPSDYVEFLLMILDFLRKGYNAQITNGVEEVLGRKPRTMKQYTEDFKNMWI